MIKNQHFIGLPLPTALLYLFVYCGGGAQMCPTSGGQKTAFWSQFLSSTLWIVRLKLRLSSMVARSFAYCAILLAQY